MIVIDASVALAWCFEDEASAATENILISVIQNGCLVPGHWHLEIANILVQAERSGRFAHGTAVDRVHLFEKLPIQVDLETSKRAFSKTFALAQHHRMTIYDAAYLELALRTQLPLGTLDKELRQAASAEGILTLPV